jgi:hypothetical protein
MASHSPVQAVIGVTGYQVESGGYGVTGERFVRIDLPRTVTEEHIALMQKDLAIMAEIAEQHPKDLTELQNAIVRHDFHSASQVARRIGLTEEHLVARGGGQVGVALQIAAVLLVASLLLSSGVEGEPGPAPTPAEPTVGLDGGAPPGGAP